MANTLTFNQVSTIVNEIVNQATGKNSIAPVNYNDLVNVMQSALLVGIDPLNVGISQVIDRTIISNRPYYAKFPKMEKDASSWGHMTRKINYVDQEFVDDSGYPLTDGTSVDHYIIRKPKVLQLNSYGRNIVADFITRTEEQLNSAFSSPEQFGEFIAGMFQNISDKHEQKMESISRATLANLILGVVTANPTNQVVHLLTEYNTVTGQSLTARTVFQEAHYSPFMKWVYSRIQSVRDLMTERSQIFHLNVTGKEINRHTPYGMQQLYMYAPMLRQMEARVLSAAFNEDRLEYDSIELVNYWQSIKTPLEVTGTPVYMGADGSVVTPETDQTVDNIFAVLCDVETIGVHRRVERTIATPLNARGRYVNYWYHWLFDSMVDYTENAVVFVLD